MPSHLTDASVIRIKEATVFEGDTKVQVWLLHTIVQCLTVRNNHFPPTEITFSTVISEVFSFYNLYLC